jgi:hypothetical protein
MDRRRARAAVGPTRAPTRAGPGRHPGDPDRAGLGPELPQNVNRKSTIEEFPAETPDLAIRCTGFGPVRSGNRLKVRALSRARVGSAEAGGAPDEQRVAGAD